MSSSLKKAVDANGVTADEACRAVETLLKYMGEDTTRNGLQDTPHRYCRALLEMTDGYQESASEILGTTFEADGEEMVILKDIEFTSLCEHHLLSFTGKAHIAYLPSKGRIVGLSKMARIVDMYAHRLQVQERLTQQIAHDIQHYLEPKGVAVVIEANHSCMCVRGVRKHNSTMVTSAMMGGFKTNPATRNELMILLNRPRSI